MQNLNFNLLNGQSTKINGLREFREDLTEAVQAAEDGKQVMIHSYTNGRKAKSILMLVKVEDLRED